MNLLPAGLLPASTTALLSGALLAAFLAAAAAVDLRTLRVPNRLTVLATLCGLMVSVLVWRPWYLALGWSIAGIATGLAVMLPMYALRALGAGDVKLMAAVGAFLGPADVLLATVLVLIAGGAIAVAVALRRRAFERLLRNSAGVGWGVVSAVLGGMRPQMHVAPGVSAGKMPYAVAIAAGTLTLLGLRLFAAL
jgi:prepilin peptidase CpaA